MTVCFSCCIFAGDTNDSEVSVALIFFALTYLVPSFTRYFLHTDGRIKIQFLNLFYYIYIYFLEVCLNYTSVTRAALIQFRKNVKNRKQQYLTDKRRVGAIKLTNTELLIIMTFKSSGRCSRYSDKVRAEQRKIMVKTLFKGKGFFIICSYLSYSKGSGWEEGFPQMLISRA